jgi:hypothetical protein
VSDPALPLGLTEHHVCPREHERAVDECAICHRDNADGRAWDEEGVAVPACARHEHAEQINGKWLHDCARCGAKCDADETYCPACYEEVWGEPYEPPERPEERPCSC